MDLLGLAQHRARQIADLRAENRELRAKLAHADEALKNAIAVAVEADGRALRAERQVMRLWSKADG